VAVHRSALPTLLAFGIFLAFGIMDGGYPATVWYPATLFLLALLALSLWGRGNALRGLSRPSLLSLAFLACLTAWTYLSIVWSDVKGEAWDGANRGLLYLIVFVLVLISTPRRRTAAVALGGFAAATTLVGAFALVTVSRSPNPDAYFLIGRLAEPTGYQNANCALFTIVLWPALLLASQRALPILVRGGFLAAAGVLVELALLSQSRGWLAAAPIALGLYFALVPQRVRSVVFALPVGVAVLVARGPLLDVFPAVKSGEEIHAALREARGAVAISAVALFLVGAALAAVDVRLWPSGATGKRLTLAGGIAFGAATAAGAAAVLIWLGNPVTRVEKAWDQFSSTTPPPATASYLTSGFGSNRYDLWRVALREIARAPMVGVGSDNFAVDYVRERRSHEEPLYPHSIELKIVAQTGAIGGVLFLAFLAAAIVAWVRRRREGPPFAQALGATCIVGFAYWLLHGSVDWFWELPGLAAPAFAMLGLAVAGDDERRANDAPLTRGRLTRAAGATLVLVAAASLVGPWLAAKERQAAVHERRRNPDDAFDRLDRARGLNPLSDEADVLAGVLASRLGRTRAMADAFRRALERNPNNWYARLELGVAYAQLGRREPALSELLRARRLNPREPTIPVVLDRVRRGLPVSTAELDRTFLERIQVSHRSPS
jgi:O-antigen ligase